ncbi:cartilage intermediate layer protein 1 [Grus japonensis]|uniref:Cartilage intermediate layer protein 1 n=1 Tax=Grus japonensis TaxID=30415 RepID=A0ABC9X978_GRUJA
MNTGIIQPAVSSLVRSVFARRPVARCHPLSYTPGYISDLAASAAGRLARSPAQRRHRGGFGLGKARDSCAYSKKPPVTSRDNDGHCKRMDPPPPPGSHVRFRSKASETSPQQDPDRTENLQPAGNAQLGKYKEQLSQGRPDLRLCQTRSTGARFQKVFVSMVGME